MQTAAAKRRFLYLAALSFALVGCASTTPTPVSVAETIAATPSLSTLNGLVAKAGLTDTLKAAGPYTVFAPSDDAFKAVSPKTLDDLARNPEQLKALLTYHMLPAKLTSADIRNSSAKTVHGANLALSKAGQYVTVEEAMVQTADIASTNGVVHLVDRVLMPPRR
ncbi:MAG TPA: fasciclin domain-containing protein [Burkholderiaceae bacterium]|nr:fasciclin domain-containing protein [Burkholderiaceae bacterium]